MWPPEMNAEWLRRNAPPPAYASREWLRRHVAAGNRPVGVLDGRLVIDLVRTGAVERPQTLCKVIGGSAEHPTVIHLTPEEMRRAVWTVSEKGGPVVYRDGCVPLPRDSHGNVIVPRGGVFSTGSSPSEKRDGPTATTWVVGGLMLGILFATKSASRRFAR